MIGGATMNKGFTLSDYEFYIGVAVGGFFCTVFNSWTYFFAYMVAIVIMNLITFIATKNRRKK